MTDELQAILEMYKIQVHRSEHYEGQRAIVSNLIVAIAAGLIALTTYDGALSASDSLVGALITILGLFGIAATKLHNNRSRRHGKRAAEYRDKLDRELPDAGINEVRNLFPRSGTYLNRVWLALHAVIAVMGLLIIVVLAAG